MNLATKAWMNGLDNEVVLSPALRNRFLSLAVVMRARRRQIVFAEGSDSDDVYLVVRGLVQVSLFSPSGRETIIREIGAGRLIGELSALLGEARSASVVAIDDTELARVSAVAFRSFLAEESEAGFWMAQQLALRVKNLTSKTVELATMPIAHRLQAELLRLAIQAGIKEDAGVIDSLPTHADLAARIGTQREAVTRELGLLAREGIATQSGRSLNILSMSRLMAIADRTSQ